ncbi:MAG: hypothetical protein QNJ75_12745 [Acidimicrobiia bacterium]|nr:hypothetical protein [Acidimicrobiia bacterium]
MSDERDIARVFIEGIEPVVDSTPPVPDWDSLQFESGSEPGGSNRWWIAAVAAVVVLFVGAGSFLLAGRLGGGSDAAGPSDAPTDPVGLAGSIEGRWVLEAWDEGGQRIDVVVGVNATDEPWIEFIASSPGIGTAGTFEGSTGCNKIRPTSYEYGAGFLEHGEVVIQAGLCDPDEAEQALLATLFNTSDGIEVIMGTDRMEWFGSNLDGMSYPLTFRRDGSPPPPATSDTSLPTTTLAPEEGLAIRVFDVAGLEVVTPSLTTELPERATRVEFHTMVIDSGAGPMLCAGIVLDSLPPQCSGPVAIGLDMEGWSEEANGVRWGERSVIVTWPPADGFVELIDDSEHTPPRLELPTEDLPAECQGIDLGAGAGPLDDYARSLGDRNGDLYVANDGTLVLQVVGDPEPHREALAELGGACVVEVSRNAAEQRAIHEAIHPLLRDIPDLLDAYSSSTGPGGRVDVYLPVVDRTTAGAIAALVDDPTAIRIVGMAVLHP